MARVDASSEARRVRPLGIAVATGLVCVGALLSLGAPFLGVPLAAGASAWLWYRRMPGPALLAVIAAGLLTLQVDPAGPLYVVPWLVLAGPVTALLVKKRSVMSVVVLIAVFNTVVWVALLAGVASAQQMSVQGYMRSLSEQAIQQAMDQASSAGQDSTVLADQAQLMEETFTRLWPAMIALLAALTALLSVGAVRLVGTRAGADVVPSRPLEEFDLDPKVVWGLIVAVAFIAVDKFSGGWNGQVLGTVGQNLLQVTRWVMFAQGLAVFAGLYKRAGFSRLSKAFGYTLLVFTELLLPLVSLTGLVDIWVNLRKLPRDGHGSSGSIVGTEEQDHPHGMDPR